MAAFGVLFISTSLRTQTRPAIEFVSGKEGLRPHIAVFAGTAAFIPYDVTLRVLVFFEIVYWDTLMFVSAAGLSGGRGEMAMAVASSARLALLLRLTSDTFPLLPVQRQSDELPATTVGECRRRHSLRRHKGGRWTVRLTSRHHVLQGGF